jgi:hypothetical protein
MRFAHAQFTGMNPTFSTMRCPPALSTKSMNFFASPEGVPLV